MIYQIDYKMVAIFLVTGILLVVTFWVHYDHYVKNMEYDREYFNIAIVVPTEPPVYPKMLMSVPSEELCQSVYGYGDQERQYLENYFCEFNESGWHFNRTKYEEAR